MSHQNLSGAGAYKYQMLWIQHCVNPLPDDKILDWSKLKAFADDKINVDEN